MKRGSNQRRQIFAVGLAALAHLLVLMGLGFRVPHMTSPPASDDIEPSVEVTLLRPAPKAGPTAPPRSGPAPAYAPRAPLAPPSPSAPPSIPLPAAPPPPPDVQASDEADRFRNALRGLTACGSANADHLTEDQRRACSQRLARAAPAPVQPDFSNGELAAFDADKAQERQGSILSRTLHDNCLPRLGDRPSPSATMGRSQARGLSTAYGVGCSFRF